MNSDCKNRRVFQLLLYMSIMTMGIIQYPLPFIGNGLADTNKQLYLFMLCWDITIFITICYVINWVFRNIVRSVNKKIGEK